MSNLREILAVFDIKVNDKELQAGVTKVDKFVEGLAKVGAALLALHAIKGAFHFGEEIVKNAREVQFHAGRMEMQVGTYQKLSQVAKEYGMTVENLQIANTLFVRSLSRVGGTLGDFAAGGVHAKDAFKNLGLDPKQFKGQGLETILPTVADAFEKIEDPIQRVTIGLNLFGHRGRSIMPMMAQGGDKLRKAFAAAIPVFEDATIHKANEAAIAGITLTRTWDHLINNTLGAAGMVVFTKVAKHLTKMVKWFENLSKNSKIGEGTLIAFGVVAAAVATALIIAFAPVLIPILALLAAFAALALAVDDFLVFMAGGDSIIGQFFDELLGPGGAAAAQKLIREMWEALKDFMAMLGGHVKSALLDDLKRALVDIRDMIHGVRRAWEDLQILLGKQVAAPLTPSQYDQMFRPGAPGSVNASAANVAPPATLANHPDVRGDIDHRPTPAQSRAGITFNMIGTIDPAKLAQDLARVAEHHMNAEMGKVMRDAKSAAGAQ